jgi:hypothetical protein
VPPIVGTAKVKQAFVAGGNIRRNRRQFSRFIEAIANHKTAVPSRFKRGNGDILNMRQRWGLPSEPAHKTIQLAAIALYFNGHARRGVQHISAQTEPLPQFVNERPEPDALHDAADVNLSSRDSADERHTSS